MPFFAISYRSFDSLKSTFHERIMSYGSAAKFMLRYQHYLYYPVLTFGRFDLYLLSWQYISLVKVRAKVLRGGTNFSKLSVTSFSGIGTAT